VYGGRRCVDLARVSARVILAMMNVLIGCEFSGTVRDAFLEWGHNAFSCDLLPTERKGPHYQMDVRRALLLRSWDLFIVHPHCTYLTNSGVRWLHTQAGRWELMREAALFFREMLEANVPRVAVENPIMHKYAAEIVGRRQDQIIQPWQFGHGETKATGLWLKNLPKLVPTNIVSGRHARVHRLPPSADRWKERSRTLPGIGEAMAEQWGNLVA
jgi:hypothetical protein